MCDAAICTIDLLKKDADLLGVPIRVIISPRNMNEHCCEIVSRDKSISMKVPLDIAQGKIAKVIQGML